MNAIWWRRPLDAEMASGKTGRAEAHLRLSTVGVSSMTSMASVTSMAWCSPIPLRKAPSLEVVRTDKGTPTVSPSVIQRR